MGSIYKPKDKKHWYIGFIDPDTEKPKHKSTGLLANQQNLKKAKEILNEVENVIKKQKDMYKNNNLERSTLLGAFQRFLKLNRNKHEKTIGDYKRFIRLFSISFDLNLPCTAINKITAENWITDLHDLNKSQNTIYNYFKVFNKFLNFLFEYSLIPLFKINTELKPRPQTKPIITFKKEDLEKIISELPTKNSNFQTFFLLMIYTGLRPSDIYMIQVKDLDMDNLTMTYYSEKSNEYFEVPIHEDIKEVLLYRIKEVKQGRMFNYSTYSEVGKAFRRYLEKLNLRGKGYNLRTFRKQFATLAYESDVNITSTSKLLGHKKIETTLKYYTHASKKKLAEDLKKIKFRL